MSDDNNHWLALAHKMRRQNEMRRHKLWALRDEAKARAARLRGEASTTAQEAEELATKRKFIERRVPHFFPTIPILIPKLLEDARLFSGCTVLEPSAGTGNIADALRAAGYEPDVVEYDYTMQRYLRETKHYHVVGTDFLEFEGAYDRIIMNPPFAKDADCRHIIHAYNCLKPGGIVVAVCGQGAFFHNTQTAKDFRNHLHSHGGTYTKLPPNLFLYAERPAGVQVYEVILEKP